MRVVLDTNVWVSALLLPQSKAGGLIEHWKGNKFDIVTSPYILSEISHVLKYPKIQKRLNWPEGRIKQFVDYLGFFTECIDLDDIVEHVPSDPKDSMILSTFIKAEAQFLITGDEDLLYLKHKHSIVTITEFYERTGLS